MSDKSDLGAGAPKKGKKIKSEGKKKRDKENKKRKRERNITTRGEMREGKKKKEN